MIAYIKDSVDENGRLIDQQPAYKKILNADVALQLNGQIFSIRNRIKGSCKLLCQPYAELYDL